MIDPARVVALIAEQVPGAQVDVKDLTGTRDHFEVSIVSDRFAGLSRLQRHRLVYAALTEQMRGEIHALTLTTWAPGEVPASRRRHL